jgi:phosphatidylethanolamine/phosphatidyl-N-methylethanolamine N-methyltransferase
VTSDTGPQPIVAPGPGPAAAPTPGPRAATAPGGVPAPPVDAASARREFVAAALRSPGKVGALLPSSATLCRRLAEVVPRAGSPVVVELGPGTGAVTTVLDGLLPPGSRHLAVELDPRMAAYLERAHPHLEVVQGDAVKLGALLAERGIEQVDAVLSGLPWALFDDDLQRTIVEQAAVAVGPDGAFTTFAYTSGLVLPAARRFRRMLRDTFEEVLVTATVWRNVPPAFTYVCRRPRA